jgi:hypothetical protein
MNNIETSLETRECWYEFKLFFSDASQTRDWPRENCDFIRSHIVPTIMKVGITNFQMLNYFNPTQGEDFIRFRVEVAPAILMKVEDEIGRLKQKGRIRDYSKESYDPRLDAERRIESVRQKLEALWGKPVSRNWKVVNLTDGTLIVDESDATAYAKKVEAFEAFLCRIVGKWTKLFVEEIDSKPDDRWLVSLFVHLMMNSIAYSGPDTGSEEDTIRKTPVY